MAFYSQNMKEHGCREICWFYSSFCSKSLPSLQSFMDSASFRSAEVINSELGRTFCGMSILFEDEM